MKILYEDKNIIAVDKPAGLMTHSDGKTKDKTLADLMLELYPEMKDVGESIKLDDGGEIQKPGIVHRLDRETSGVILLAKNQETFLFLKNQFKERELQKTYVAIVYGHVKNDMGIIDAPIARSSTDFRRWTASRGQRGKQRASVTEYHVLKRFEHKGQKYSVLELHPKTGRTHQIRVHMKFLNHPVVCDKLYAPSMECPALGMDRLALHAKSIEFMEPDGKQLKIEAPLPSDLSQAINIDAEKLLI
jgi:23S rRNA pseudouridine1911/1915/1917 synthase